MKNFARKGAIYIFVLAIIAGSFGAGFYFGENHVVCKICAPEEIDFSPFWEAYHMLQEKYVDPSKITPQSVLYGAISGMVNALGDPYTVFFPPNESKKFLEDVSGRFEGVGMEVGIKNKQLQVVSPIEGSPAQKAGLLPGDKILKIDGKSTSGLTVEEAVSLIRGPKDTEVMITIFRDGWQKNKDIKIKRDFIIVPSLKWEMKDGDIAYVKLYQFTEKASYDFSKAAIEIINSPAKKIILDLRNNPGGYLTISQDIAGWFLDKNQLVVVEDFVSKKEKNEYRTNGNGALKQYPLVVLINEGSASASEILAGALRDNRKIKLVGEQSYGKGSVQELKNLRGGASLKITVANWLTPKGNTITNIGLAPDVKVEMTSDDYDKNKDPQLEKAIEIVNGIK